MVVGTHKCFRLSIIFGWMNHGPKKVQPICKLVGPFPNPTVSKVLRGNNIFLAWLVNECLNMVRQDSKESSINFFFLRAATVDFLRCLELKFDWGLYI